jgi:chemotaxis signal transduction protein
MGEVPEWLLLFRTGTLRFGVDVAAVTRVILACETDPLPGAPASVRGVTVVSDAVVPVIDPVIPFKGHGKSGPSATTLGLDCRFVMVQTPRRLLAVIAEEVDGIRRGADMPLIQPDALPGIVPELMGISIGSDGLVYVSDPERLISDADEIQLQAVLADLSHGRP